MQDGRSARSKAVTRLAEKRLERGLTQEQMSRATGIPLTTYKRLELGEVWNPGIRYLTNCAVVLGCESWDELLDEELLDWTVFGEGPEDPPPPEWWKKPEAHLPLKKKRRR